MRLLYIDGIRFKIQLNESDTTEIIDKTKPIHLLVAWAVQIDKFYPEIERDLNQSLYSTGLEFFQTISLKVEHEILTDLKKYKFCLYIFNKINNFRFSFKISQKEFFFKIPDGECTDRFASLDSQQTVRNHYHVVVTLFKDSTELPTLSPNDIVGLY